MTRAESPPFGRIDPVSRREESPTGEQDRSRFLAEPAWLIAGLVGVGILAWIAVIFLVSSARFVVLSPQLQAGVEAASVFARLFGALVLFLFPGSRFRTRLRWIAAGIALLGLGGFFFGYLPPLVSNPLSVSEAIFVSTCIWTGAAVLFLVGLVPDRPPAVSGRTLGWATLVVAGVLSAILLSRDALPPLVDVVSLEDAASYDRTYLSGLTGWYWAVSLLPVALSLGTVAAVAARRAEVMLGGWLVLAMTLFAGSQLHNLFWPSVYSPVLTTSSLLRLAFAVAVAVAGALGLRQVATEHGRLAAERAVLLETAQEYGRRLTELAVLKADFTAMVAHELGAPIAAIRRCSDALSSGLLDGAGQQRMLAAIQSEIDLLATLGADVQAIAAIERDDFAVRPLPVPVGALLADAEAFAETLPGHHSVAKTASIERVMADPERIGQVIRNLLANAAKYSPDGSPIEVRVRQAEDRVRVEVTDHGDGIHPNDLERIIEKFGRGRDRFGRHQHGLGLGLYVSRRIVKAHGGELTVRSSLGHGSTFGFDLERVSR